MSRSDIDISSRRAGPHRPRRLYKDRPIRHLLTLADLSPKDIRDLLVSSMTLKALHKQSAADQMIRSMENRTVALLFSKRSTRTRVASESATAMLGGHSMFLGKDDIQLGVNESLEDTAKIIGSMVDGLMARVGAHAEVETLAAHAKTPVINALSDLWHPTQILADLLGMVEAEQASKLSEDLFKLPTSDTPHKTMRSAVNNALDMTVLAGKKVVWVGDVNNVLNDMLVAYPRLGMTMAVAAPKGYDKIDERVWKRVEEGGHADKVTISNSPAEALKDADYVVTDTWISMGQEAEKADRLKAFAGYQVTEKLCSEAGAKPDWKFMHCLPRKQEEVDDDVFYGKRSMVFPVGENRKWTIAACFK